MKKIFPALPSSQDRARYVSLPAMTTMFLIIASLPKISFAQNVGIATTSPLEKLHVNGNIKGDTLKPNAIKLITNAGAGKLLTSDAQGNANWQNFNSAAAGNLGYGVWGDCATTAIISEYYPVSNNTVTNDAFGSSVAISGDFAIIGAPQDNGPGGNFQGSISFYHYDGVSWVFMEKIFDATGSVNDLFGNRVAISGNYAIAGAFSDDGPGGLDQGSASIYQFNGTNWVLMQKLTDATGAANDLFGFAVSISGNYAIVGAWRDDSPTSEVDKGSASIYQYNGSNWSLMQKITDATGAANDFFGYSVSLSGNRAIVGAYGDAGPGGAGQGSASIYQYNGISWVLMQKITDQGGAASDNFGMSVAISGDYAIVGAPYDDFTVTDQGSAIVYKYNGSAWIQFQRLLDLNGASSDFFGKFLTISDNYAIVGAFNHNQGSGSATIYQRIGSAWAKLLYVTDPAASVADYFGNSVAIDGKKFLIGAPEFASSKGKAIFGKIN